MSGSRRARRRLAEFVRVAGVAVLVVVAVTYGGPVSSGALILLWWPAPASPQEHDLPAAYVPEHRGYIDIGTGLYVRRDEDLVVRGTPPLILGRTYLSEYHVQREFGIGATHDGERYVRGDGERFQWAALVLPEHGSIEFSRVSFGRFLRNAMFEHRNTPSEYLGARLGWSGFHWVLRRRDGFMSEFQGCGPGIAENCSVIRDRDQDGHVIEYRRDARGRLARIETGPDRWIGFTYDPQGRVAAASDSTGAQVLYSYDAGGRLVRATSGRVTRRYAYTDADELARIDEPDSSIQNFYRNGRCIRQVTLVRGGSQPFAIEFAYEMAEERIRRVRETRSDGTWAEYLFDTRRYEIGQTVGFASSTIASFVYQRDPETRALTGVQLTCRSESGSTVSEFSAASRPSLDAIKQQLVEHVRCIPQVTSAPARDTPHARR